MSLLPSFTGDEHRAAGVAHDPRRIRAEQVILHCRPMRSDDDQINPSFFGDSQNLTIDARPMDHEDFRIEVRGVDAADQGGKPIFEVRDDQLVAQGRGAGLKDRLNLAHDREDMKLGPEFTRKLDRR